MFDNIRAQEERIVQRLRWVKNHPERRAAVQALLEIGEELSRARQGIEQQIAEARWDHARAALQSIERELNERWEKLF